MMLFHKPLKRHFSKPKTAFLGDMFYGLMAGGDVKLSKICRAYRPTITMKKAGDRLCMHLDDRGGDNIEFYRYFLRKNVDFIVRLKSRSVISWKRRLMCDDLAAQCTLRYADTITFDSHGKTFRVVLNYGVVPEFHFDDKPDLFTFFACDE